MNKNSFKNTSNCKKPNKTIIKKLKKRPLIKTWNNNR